MGNYHHHSSYYHNHSQSHWPNKLVWVCRDTNSRQTSKSVASNQINVFINLKMEAEQNFSDWFKHAHFYLILVFWLEIHATLLSCWDLMKSCLQTQMTDCLLRPPFSRQQVELTYWILHSYFSPSVTLCLFVCYVKATTMQLNLKRCVKTFLGDCYITLQFIFTATHRPWTMHEKPTQQREKRGMIAKK